MHQGSLEKLFQSLRAHGIDIIEDADTGEIVGVDMSEKDEPQRFDDEGNIVHRDDLIMRQMETIDALRGALAAVSRSVEALACGPRGGGQAALPPGKVAIEEDQLRQYIDKIEGLVAEIDEVEMVNTKLTEMLRQFSYAFGYDGDIDRDFEKMVKGMPHPGAPKPSRYLLPDGTKTDQVGVAIFEWQHLDEAAYEKANAAALAVRKQ